MRLILNSEGEPDKSVDDWSTEAKEKKVLVLDGDQGERELDLVYIEFTSLLIVLWCVLHLQEEVEPLKEHPVEAGKVEEVGEGEGGAEQGLRKVRRHLEVVKVVSMVKVAKKIKVAKGCQDVQDYLRGRTRFFHERVRIQLRAERPKVQNNPMWILCRRQRISLKKKLKQS